jgi:hypothetical protein
MIEEIRPRTADPPPLASVQAMILPYMPGLKWIAEHKCDCTAMMEEIEKAVRAYKDSPERTQVLDGIASLRRPI